MKRRILAVATQGTGGDDETRLRALVSGLPKEYEIEFFPFDRKSKWKSFYDFVIRARSSKPDLVILEGTGLGGGGAALMARALSGIPYIVSSGDAVGPFVAGRVRWAAPVFQAYERALCRFSSGYVGWTPYLTGRALTFGAGRAMTAANWDFNPLSEYEWQRARIEIREKYSIPASDLVIGIAGSLAWNPRVKYCYGLEIIKAMSRIRRKDLHALIVGDGNGRPYLDTLIGDTKLKVHFTGRIPHSEVSRHLAAMDIGSLPQSLDQVGNFRYTTKLSEYLGSRLPVVTGRLPFTYDLGSSWLWRLPGKNPWEENYLNALAELLETVQTSAVEEKRAAMRAFPSLIFDSRDQIARFTEFVTEAFDSK